MRTQGDVICDEAGAPLRMVGVCEDVTDEVRAREAERRLAAVESRDGARGDQRRGHPGARASRASISIAASTAQARGRR